MVSRPPRPTMAPPNRGRSTRLVQPARSDRRFLETELKQGWSVVANRSIHGRVQETQANGELHMRRQEEKPVDEEAWQVNAELRVSEQLAVVSNGSAVAEEFADACRA